MSTRVHSQDMSPTSTHVSTSAYWFMMGKMLWEHNTTRLISYLFNKATLQKGCQHLSTTVCCSY